MDNSNPTPDEILELCDVIEDDDGVSPLEIAKRGRKQSNSDNSNRSRYRLRQLCKQVQHGIDDAFLCDCCDPLLSELRTIHVKPISGSSALIATVVTKEHDPATITMIHERLKQGNGIIRSAVASVISRKRVPQIQFRVVPEQAL